VNCYSCQYVFDSKDCTGSFYLTDCAACSDCILCSNLANASYCIRNQKYTREEYMKLKDEMITGSQKQRDALMKEFLEIRNKRKVKFAHIVNCQDSEGEYLANCKNCFNCFDVSNSEDLCNVISADFAKDILNSCYIGHKTELCLDSLAVLGAYNVQHSYLVFIGSDVEYSEISMSCKNIFGCIGLKSKQYCILNKQYSREDFESLRAKIIEHMKKTGEWGKFLPQEMSCFGYNESTAYEYYPLTKEQALERGFKWSDISTPAGGATGLESGKLPDRITEVGDEILNNAIISEASSRPYKILKPELEFYRKHRLPLPRLHPEDRYQKRNTLRNPFKVFNRTCTACAAPLKSSYAFDRPENVYCESCYLKEVY
jgi:hypothetical protein